jgi:methionine synthase II (cobalamin-independent)
MLEARMTRFRPRWLPFAIGSLPHVDVSKAWAAVLRYLPGIPSWPQLPRRAYRENMYAQFGEGFPGITVEDERIYVDRRKDLDVDLERLYLAYLEDDVDYGELGESHAAGLHALLKGRVALPEGVAAVKGQVTGPVSWGLTIVDQNQRPILYDEVLADAVGKHLRLKAAWQERELARIAPRTVVMIDEPYMASFGSSFVSLSREQAIGLLQEVFAGIQGIKGVHCCGNTDWSVLLSTSTDILSLDAYEYAETLALYPEEVARYLERGGILAWGIAPSGPAAEYETVESLVDRLHHAIGLLANKGVPEEALFQVGLVSPSCGLGPLEPALAERVLELTAGVATEMQRRYGATQAGEAMQAASE